MTINGAIQYKRTIELVLGGETVLRRINTKAHWVSLRALSLEMVLSLSLSGPMLLWALASNSIPKRHTVVLPSLRVRRQSKRVFPKVISPELEILDVR